MKKTPMMQQYEEIKNQHPGFLLFYRMGDFYELFGDDALTAAAVLAITLTQRRTSKEEDGVPMCGVPFHAAESYIAKLLKNGHKVALCEQTEDPTQAKKNRGSKALVNREVVRLYTKGTLTEDSMLPEKSANHLVAIHQIDGTLALSWLDLASGVFEVTTTSPQNLAAELARLQPGELLLTEETEQAHQESLTLYKYVLTTPFGDLFSGRNSERTLKQHLGVSTLDGFGFTSPAQIAVCGALVGYISQTQKTPQSSHAATLPRPRVVQAQNTMHLDPATRTNLELTRTLGGQRKGSLLHALDGTVTAAGARMLESWLNAPLTNLGEITARQAAIQTFVDTPDARHRLRGLLKGLPDISRALTRLSFNRGGPRDMAAIRQGLCLLPEVLETLTPLNNGTLLDVITESLSGHDDLRTLLTNALKVGDIPMLARDGDFIADGYCAELDGNRHTSNNALTLLQDLERREAEALGISSLRVRYNKVWGYYIELTKTHSGKVPDRYIHRQTTTQTQRFTTPELIEVEQNVASAGSRARERELALYEELRQSICQNAQALLATAHGLAMVDVLCNGAELAHRENLTCPHMTTDHRFNITGGRHSVVEKTVDTFVANDCALIAPPSKQKTADGNALWLVTGPNMAGKSTFLRQNALLAIVAHAGLYVPAEKAEIGIIDRIFTRVGAADDLARGQSTFMVEMVETANILNNATDRSLVILDEIGRGTATYDGLSIAWACVEHLVKETRCRALFATHYHELTPLEDTFPAVSNRHVAVKEWQDDIVFLHEVRTGASPRSYGIHVGRLAGLPPAVTKRAESLLRYLESRTTTASGNASATEQISLFDVTTPTTPQPAQPQTTEPTLETPLQDALDDVQPDTLTPLQALEILYQLKQLTHPTPKESARASIN